MSDKTQNEHNGSAYPSIADIRANLICAAVGQLRTRRLSFSLRQGLCDFAGTVEEKLCGGAERAVLQGDDPDWRAGMLQFNGQDLEFRAPGGKSQYGHRDNRKKAPSRQETDPYLGGNGEHSRARII